MELGGEDYVYIQGNRVANATANPAINKPVGFHVYNNRPDEILQVLQDDVEGKAIPSFIVMQLISF